MGGQVKPGRLSIPEGPFGLGGEDRTRDLLIPNQPCFRCTTPSHLLRASDARASWA